MKVEPKTIISHVRQAYMAVLSNEEHQRGLALRAETHRDLHLHHSQKEINVVTNYSDFSYFLSPSDVLLAKSFVRRIVYM